MTPANISLATGTLLGFVAAVIVIGYTQPAPMHPCNAVSQAYEQTHLEVARTSFRGTQDDTGLSESESAAISVANAVAKSLGVSCYVTPES